MGEEAKERTGRQDSLCPNEIPITYHYMFHAMRARHATPVLSLSMANERFDGNKTNVLSPCLHVQRHAEHPPCWKCRQKQLMCCFTKRQKKHVRFVIHILFVVSCKRMKHASRRVSQIIRKRLKRGGGKGMAQGGIARKVCGHCC